VGLKRKKRGFEYGYIGMCSRYVNNPAYRGRKRLVRVENTIYNILMCCGCRYFKAK
jgi:hypothetical protein